MSLAVLSRAACASMSTTTTTTTTTTRDRGHRYGPIEWAQLPSYVKKYGNIAGAQVSVENNSEYQIQAVVSSPAAV